MNEEHIPEYDRIIAHDEDIAATRKKRSFYGSENQVAVAKDIIGEMKTYLDSYEVETREDLDRMLAEIDTAIAINNDPRAHELRHTLTHRYHNREALL